MQCYFEPLKRKVVLAFIRRSGSNSSVFLYKVTHAGSWICMHMYKGVVLLQVISVPCNLSRMLWHYSMMARRVTLVVAFPFCPKIWEGGGPINGIYQSVSIVWIINIGGWGHSNINCYNWMELSALRGSGITKTLPLCPRPLSNALQMCYSSLVKLSLPTISDMVLSCLQFHKSLSQIPKLHRIKKCWSLINWHDQPKCDVTMAFQCPSIRIPLLTTWDLQLLDKFPNFLSNYFIYFPKFLLRGNSLL